MRCLGFVGNTIRQSMKRDFRLFGTASGLHQRATDQMELLATLRLENQGVTKLKLVHTTVPVETRVKLNKADYPDIGRFLTHSVVRLTMR